MRITVKLGGPLRDRVTGHRDGELLVELRSDTWTSEVLDNLNLEPDDVALFILNGRPLCQDKLLCHCDRLALFPPCMAYMIPGLASGRLPAWRPRKEVE